MPVTNFLRANSHVPGPGVGDYYYAAHSSRLSRLYVYRPDAPFTNAPVFVFFHGGDDFTLYGDAACHVNGQDSDVGDLCRDLAALGWAVVSVEIPAGAFHSDKTLQFAQPALFPEAEAFAARAISHLKDNAVGATTGAGATEFGTTLWGAGNSIDPTKVVACGISSGATMAVLNALTPASHYAHSNGLLSRAQDSYLPRSSHRVAAVIGKDFAADWTQFDVDTADNSVEMDEDQHPHFMRQESLLAWSTFANRVKMAASPYWNLVAGYPENAGLPVYLTWAKSTDADGLSLSAIDWTPGTRLSDAAGAKAFRDPGHHYQGQPMGNAVAQYLDPRSIVRWGDSVLNPGTPHLTGSAFVTEVRDWLTDTLGL